MFDHHHARVGHVHANFDHRGRNQNVDVALLKTGHRRIFFFGRHAPVQQADAQPGQLPLAQRVVHLDGGLQFAAQRAFVDHRIDHVRLLPRRDLLAHKLPDLFRLLVPDPRRLDRRAPWRKLIEHAGLKVAVERECQRSRNRRCRHHQHVGLCSVSFLHQLEALHHAEAMLFVDDDQPEFVELHRLLDERVCAYRQLRVTLRDVVPRLLLARRLLRTGQQHNAIARGLENAPRRKIMLRRQNFRRRHQCDLVSILDGDHRGFERDDRLT